MVVFDDDGLVGLGDGLSVDCDFDHFQVSLRRESVDVFGRQGGFVISGELTARHSC